MGYEKKKERIISREYGWKRRIRNIQQRRMMDCRSDEGREKTLSWRKSLSRLCYDRQTRKSLSPCQSRGGMDGKNDAGRTVATFCFRVFAGFAMSAKSRKAKTAFFDLFALKMFSKFKRIQKFEGRLLFCAAVL